MNHMVFQLTYALFSSIYNMIFREHLGYGIIKTRYSVSNCVKNSIEQDLNIQVRCFPVSFHGSYSRLHFYFADKHVCYNTYIPEVWSNFKVYVMMHRHFNLNVLTIFIFLLALARQNHPSLDRNKKLNVYQCGKKKRKNWF